MDIVGPINIGGLNSGKDRLKSTNHSRVLFSAFDWVSPPTCHPQYVLCVQW